MVPMVESVVVMFVEVLKIVIDNDKLYQWFEYVVVYFQDKWGIWVLVQVIYFLNDNWRSAVEYMKDLCNNLFELDIEGQQIFN